MPAVLMGGSIGGEVSFLNERELVRGVPWCKGARW